ncbi:hypothetical protein ACJX0J_023326, partial [Zea mays]
KSLLMILALKLAFHCASGKVYRAILFFSNRAVMELFLFSMFSLVPSGVDLIIRPSKLLARLPKLNLIAILIMQQTIDVVTHFFSAKLATSFGQKRQPVTFFFTIYNIFELSTA